MRLSNSIMLTVGKGEEGELNHIESEELMNQIEKIQINSGWEDFSLQKVWFDYKTCSIRAFFKHPIIGSVSGTVKPNFVVRYQQSIADILENVTINKVRLTMTFNSMLNHRIDEKI